MISLKKEEALLGLRTVIDLVKIKKASHYKIRDRYYKERAKMIRKRGASILSAQKVRLAKGAGITRSAVLHETQAEIELDLMALIYEDEIMRYNAAKQ